MFYQGSTDQIIRSKFKPNWDGNEINWLAMLALENFSNDW